MFIYCVEVWEFLKDGILVLYKIDGKVEWIYWKLKGYGWVFKLYYGDEKDEFYDVDVIFV